MEKALRNIYLNPTFSIQNSTYCAPQIGFFQRNHGNTLYGRTNNWIFSRNCATNPDFLFITDFLTDFIAIYATQKGRIGAGTRTICKRTGTLFLTVYPESGMFTKAIDISGKDGLKVLTSPFRWFLGLTGESKGHIQFSLAIIIDHFPLHLKL